MKKRLLLLCAALPAFFYAGAQTYSGRLGYALSPAGFPNDFSQTGVFLQEAAALCGNGVVYANGDWRDDTASAGTIPTLQKTIAQLQPVPYGYTDMLTFAWATYPALHLNTLSDPTNNWTNASMRSLFLQALIRTADSLQPAYLFIGNEVDFYFVQDSLDYYNWISFYETAYDSVKAHSPGTKVGTVFSYEHLSGNGALTGDPGWMTSHWHALDDIDTARMDVVGISCYPFFQYSTANAVPGSYLDPLFLHIGGKPLVLTETGWPGDSIFGPWNAGPQQQIDFVNRLFSAIGTHNVEDVNWLYLNYMMSNDTSAATLIFKSVALRDSLGNDRPALALWQSMCTGNAAGMAWEREIPRPYPNPSSGELHFTGLSGTRNELSLSDMLGREILHVELPNGGSPGLTLAPGLYFYRITIDGRDAGSGKLLVSGH